ncbi:uncharacterized protein FOMMEDRAFT_157826 [Fomitiporia mediterranea MF3/22]|uniref:uncharacterized protein n=1 Tax=Fomitiporia mediterranea (strain MF3/22) TaxID=694068 RepID=UPI000440997B|nr:uncharacterized protein FOMMEDRAFT_157826 [Fomitiporia mediterranea MF3/22]EJD00725.1 hypothetical protein FOMMEDRAFT_157826 [Fomitiporia mediterranea MF3/22]
MSPKPGGFTAAEKTALMNYVLPDYHFLNTSYPPSPIRSSSSSRGGPGIQATKESSQFSFDDRRPPPLSTSNPETCIRFSEPYDSHALSSDRGMGTRLMLSTQTPGDAGSGVSSSRRKTICSRGSGPGRQALVLVNHVSRDDGLDQALVIATTKDAGDAFALVLKPVLWTLEPRERVEGVAYKQERWKPGLLVAKLSRSVVDADSTPNL